MNAWTKAGLYFIFVLLIIELVIEISGFYQSISFLDEVMHFLGGFGVGLFAIGLYLYNDTGNNHLLDNDWYNLLFILGFVAVVGVLWEFFEFGLDQTINYSFQLNAITQPTLRDTMGDLAMDLIGAIGAIVYKAKLLKNYYG